MNVHGTCKPRVNNKQLSKLQQLALEMVIMCLVSHVPVKVRYIAKKHSVSKPQKKVVPSEEKELGSLAAMPCAVMLSH